MAPIDLLPPALWRNMTFPLAERQMQDLNGYITFLIILPVTSRDYQNDLGLKSMDEVKDSCNVTSVLQVYNQYREHFRVAKNICQLTADLARSLYHYSRDIVKIEYSELYQVVNCPTGPIDKNRLEGIIDYVVENLRYMDMTCEKIIGGLGELETWTKESKLNLQVQRNFMAPAIGHDHDQPTTGRGQPADSRLQNEVKSLNEFSKTLDGNTEKEEEEYCVPLAGFVPTANSLNNENGKKAADFTPYDNLNALKACNNLQPLELIQSHVDLTIRVLDEIVGSIEPVTETIQSLRKYFEGIIDGLNNILIKTSSQTTRGDQVFSAEIDDVLAEWGALGERGRLYSEWVWVDAVEVNTLL